MTTIIAKGNPQTPPVPKLNTVPHVDFKKQTAIVALPVTPLPWDLHVRSGATHAGA